MIGGAAGDTITGSRPANALFGGGPDSLFARDGTTTADTLNCGGGRDGFQIDPVDLFAAGAGCEAALP